MKNLKKPRSKPAKPLHSQRHKAKQIVRQSRPVHHRVFLHPVTVFILLCIGVSIVNMTYRAHAGQYTITAKVSAPALTDAATLDSPNNGDVFTSSPISVKGTCPNDSYVVLYRNASLSGVAFCSALNTYEIQTSLYLNGNILKVQAFNLTDDAGPITPEITVTYNPPIIITSLTPSTTVTGPQQTGDNTATIPDSLPVITIVYTYHEYATDRAFEWAIDIAGGTSPYQINTHWGDGTSTLQTALTAQSLMISHQYSKTGIYIIKVNLIDASGKQNMLQLVAIIKEKSSHISVTNSLNNDGNTSLLSSGLVLLARNWLVLVWGSYATVLLMAISFWLGEQQKINVLVHAKHTRARYKKSH